MKLSLYKIACFFTQQEDCMNAVCTEVIMVYGQLTLPNIKSLRDQTERALQRLEKERTEKELIFVFNSQGGLFCPDLMSLIERLWETKVATAAKIYRADSAASWLCLAMKRREIDKHGSFAFHNAYIETSAGHVNLETGVISPIMRKKLAMTKANLSRIMEKSGITLNSDMKVKLGTKDRLSLTLEQCIDTNIVSRIT